MSDERPVARSCEVGDGRCADLPSQVPVWIGLVLLLVILSVAATLLHHPGSAPNRPAPAVEQQAPQQR